MRYVKIKYQLINYLRCPKFSAFQDKKKVKRLKHRITIDGLNLDKCIRVIKTDVRLCMLYRSLPPPLPPPFDRPPPSGDKSEICHFSSSPGRVSNGAVILLWV